MEQAWYILELVGIAAFAASGVFIGTRKGLDVFGICVIGVTTALGGGFLRDITLGIIPPRMFITYEYALTAMIVSLVLFVFFKMVDDHNTWIDQMNNVVNIPDTIGLGLFTVVGSQAAIESGFGDNPFLVIFVGAITGVGGGVFRDVLTATVPYILRKHVYALASISGAVVFYLFYWSGHQDIGAMVAAGVVILIRILASIHKWNLPRVE